MNNVSIDCRTYKVEVLRRVDAGAESVRMIIPTYILSDAAWDIVDCCIKSIQKFTLCPYEIWVVDNNSPKKYREKFRAYEGINCVLNHTEPMSPRHRNVVRNVFDKIFGRARFGLQGKDGSYANAVGLELGCLLIPRDTKYVFLMHSDTLALKAGWMQYLKSKLNDSVKAVGCWQDNIRVNALHIGGLLMEFEYFLSLKMDCFPNIRCSRYPEADEYDVGDLITLILKQHGYVVHVCRNTYNDEQLVETIPETDGMRFLYSDRCIDEDGDVFYSHLGRGTPKSCDAYEKEGRTYADDWITYARKYVLSE